MPPDLLAPRLDDLVLARLVTRKTHAASTELAAELAAYAPSHVERRAWEAAIDASVGRTVEPADARALAERLGVSGKVQWQPLVARILPMLALGIAADDRRGQARLAKREDWAAAIVGRAHGIWTDGPAPRLAVVCDTLVWRALALPGKAKKTPPEIRAHFLHRNLGAGSGPPEKLLPLLAARELGIVRADLRALREALVRRWLTGQEWRPGAATATTAEPAARAPSIGDFARAVRDSAERATDGLFGGRKVFIASLWQGMRSHPTFGALTLDEFKSQLVAAHKAGLVALARADLTAAMDPGVVRDSETAHLEARYHFVERGGMS